MLIIVFAHIAGVIIESYLHKEKLILSMITGRKKVPEDMPAVASRTGIAIILLIILLAYLLSAGIGLIPGKEAFESQFTGKPLPMSDVWQQECSSCHLAYHPSLLPARSWEKLLQQQHDHFAEDLYLEQQTVKQLADYARTNSAEQGMTEPARKIMDLLKSSEIPLRITDTRYWIHKHDEVADKVWKQTNVNGKNQCESCHSDAKQGWFEDARMSIPIAAESLKPSAK